MGEKILEQLQIDERLRHLAMQLAVQLQPLCDNKDEAQEVLCLVRALVDWQYGPARSLDVQPLRDFRIVD